MADLSDARRDALHGFLQDQGPPECGSEGSLLTGWVIVVEWMDPDGERMLTKAHSASTTKLDGRWDAPPGPLRSVG